LGKRVPREKLHLLASHAGAGRLENVAFAFGEAVDSVGADFVEDGIDLPADEFRGGKILGRSGPGAAEKG
jgi:hypothetical protein